MQISFDNVSNYPTSDYSAELVIGHGWIAFDPLAWPDGISLHHLGEMLIEPRPTWLREKMKIRLDLT